MKKIFITLICIACLVSSLWAQCPEERIFFNVTTTPAITTMHMQSSELVQSKVSMGGNIGAEVQWNPMQGASNIYFSLGFQFSSFGVRSVLNNVYKQENLYAYGVGNYSLTTTFTDLQEQIRLHTLGIPVGIYYKGDFLQIGAGVEASALLNATSQIMKGTITTDFHSDVYSVDISHEANIHGITCYEIDKGPMQALDLNRVSLMPFVDVSIPMKNVSVGFFVGYGLNSQCRADVYKENPLVSIGDKLQYHGVAHSDQISLMNKLMMGLRLRYSIERKFIVIQEIIGCPCDTTTPPPPPPYNCKRKIESLRAQIDRMLEGKYNETEANKIYAEYEEVLSRCAKDPAVKSMKVEELREYGNIYMEFLGYVTKALEKGNDRVYRSNAIIDFCDDIKKSAYWNRNNGTRYSYIDEKIRRLLDEAEAIRANRLPETRNSHWNQFKQIAETF